MRVGDYRGQISGVLRVSIPQHGVQDSDVVIDDRSRTAFHTINNRYRRPVVNPELSSRGAGRRWKIEEQEEAARCYRETRKQLEEPSVPSSTRRGFSRVPYYRSTLAKESVRSDAIPINSFQRSTIILLFKNTVKRKMSG